MKNKILIVILISLIVMVAIFIYIKLNNNMDELDIEYIKYSTGGGFGTQADCATKTIVIQKDGYVKFTNTYNKDLIQEFKIDEELVCELENYINENRKVFLKRKITDNGAMDASTQYLFITTKDGKEYKIGGYCVIDNQFKLIVNKLIETVGKEKYREYYNDIKKSEI